jgi:S-(hydroxymethyl)glutathione dehydrogenase/alcohol dehydrogenase
MHKLAADVPKKFRAAILVEQNKPLVIDHVEMPSEIGIGQAVVKLTCTGICGSQLGEISGAKGPDSYLPHLLGHEAHGIVVQAGPGVKHVAAGDSVVLHWRRGVGEDAEPPKYMWQDRQVNAGWITTFNEWAVISANRLTKVPKDLNPEVAALFGCAVTTGLGVVENNAQVRLGEAVLVYGAGGVGLNIIQGAALSGASPIIAVDLFDNRLELARQMGATHTINSKTESIDAQSMAKLLPSGLDVGIDNTGAPEIIQKLYDWVKPAGRVILVGVPRKGNNIQIYSLPLHFGKQIKGSQGGEVMPARDIPRYLNLYNAKKMHLENLITYRGKLDDINSAINKMKSGEMSGRCMIQF